MLFITLNCVGQKINLTPLDTSNFMLADEEMSVVTETDTFWVSAYIVKDYKNIFQFYGFRIAKNKNIQCVDSVFTLKIDDGTIIKTNLIHKDDYNLYFSPEENVLELLRTQVIVSIRFNGEFYSCLHFPSHDYFKRLISQYAGQMIAYQMLPDSTVKK